MEPDDMQEHLHTKTTPGEPTAPEIVPHAVHNEPGGNTQAEDINIPLLTVAVAGFAAFLIVIIVALQAWFYNADTAERDAKWRPDPTLSAKLNEYDNDLHNPAGINPRVPGADKANFRRVPISDAIEDTIKRYAQAGTSK